MDESRRGEPGPGNDIEEGGPENSERLEQVKKAINNIIWEQSRPEVTMRQAEAAAIKALDVIWPLCEREEK